MAHVLTTGEKITQRKAGQWSRLFLAVPEYHVIYTARLNGVPATNDMVSEISFDTGSGTLGNVFADMTLYIGSSPGGFEYGICRIRKSPISGTFYVGETAEIDWQDNAYLTVVDDYQIWQKSLRIVDEVPYMDWDVPYSDQHADFDPVPAMGTHRVAKLVGASVDVTLGAASDTPAWVIDSTISSHAWSVSGATLDSATAVNPVATFTAPGTYLAYCVFTAANGKTFRGVRYVIIWDDDNPPLGNFQLRNGRYSSATGGGSFEVALFSDMDTSSFRERSLVILFAEDYNEDGAVVMPHQITGAENIIACGYISDISAERDSETGGLSFVVESPEYWMRQIRDFPSGLELKVGDAETWTDMPSMTVRRALWHFLHWRSTVTRVMDVQITDDDRLATRFQTARANLWERLIQAAQPTIYATPKVDPYGRLFIEVEPQMEAQDDRSFPVAMTITDDDIEGDIRWIRRDVKALSMLFFSGVAINASGGANSFFSMSPGHSYGHHGEEETQDNYLVGSQSKANSMCGCYYGWRNNPIEDIEINFKHSFRVPVTAPRQFFEYEITAEADPRGIGYSGNWIVREWSFDCDPDTGFLRTAAIFEPEATPGSAVNGDVPTMEDIDFSIPELPDLPGLPLLPPLPAIALPSSVTNTSLPKKIIVADTKGVHYTETFDGASPIFLSMTLGLDDTMFAGADKLLIVTPSKAIWLLMRGAIDKLYRAAGLGGTWELMADSVSLDGGYINGIGVNPNDPEQIAVVAGTTDEFYGPSRLWIGSSSGLTAGSSTWGSRPYTGCAVLFKNNNWYVFYSSTIPFSTAWAVKLTASGGAVSNADINTAAGQDNMPRFAALRAADFFEWDSGASGGFNIITTGLVETRYTTLNPTENPQGVAFSPDGTIAMGASRTTLTPYKSTDGGLSWTSVGGTLSTGSDIWENCKDNNRFIFGGGSTLRFTNDLGSSFIERSGNLSLVAPMLDVQSIRFVE